MGEIILLCSGFATTAISLFFLSKYKNKSQALAEQCQELKKVQKNFALKEQHLHEQIKSKSQALEKNKKLKKLEKDLEASKSKFEEQKQVLERTISEQKQRMAKLKHQLEHFECQAEALTTQLKEHDQDKKLYRQKFEEQNQSSEKKHTDKINNLTSKINELQNDKKDLQAELNKKAKHNAKLQEKIKALDPYSVKKAKAKIGQYNHLYKIMRGQKELTEERNENWELALKLLSHWVIDLLKPKNPKTENIGQLVATALEATKSGPLIKAEDDISIQYRQELEELAREKITGVKKPVKKNLSQQNAAKKEIEFPKAIVITTANQQQNGSQPTENLPLNPEVLN